jgi:hypothetical protein
MEDSPGSTESGAATISTEAQDHLAGAAATAAAEAARTAAAAEGGQCPEVEAATVAEATGGAAEAAHGEMNETNHDLF